MFRLVTVVLVVVLLTSPLDAAAGVTLHYEGHAVDATSVEKALVALQKQAEQNGWLVSDASSANASLTRVVDEKDVHYRGRVRGIRIRPHPMCEPVVVQFDSKGFMQDFVKTQFAGAEIHVMVVQLLSSLRPFMRDLSVSDEGEYWETRDRSKLEMHISKVNSLISEMKKEKPARRGPVMLQNGRIADLLE